jgi:hypothetical protein
MLKHFSLSDVVVSRVFVSSRFGFRFAIGFRLVVVCVVGFDPRCGQAWPGPAQSGPRAPAPYARPPGVFLSFDFLPRSNLPLPPLSLSPWCPRVWRR